MHKYKHDQPTVGVLAGWHVYGETGALDTFLGPLYRGIRSAAHEQGCNLLLACGVGSGIEQESPRRVWPLPSPDVDFVPVGPWNVDGLIAVGRFMPESRSRYLHQLISEGCPVVFVGAGESGPTVIADNEGGIRQAVQHLVEHGHRRIAFIAGRKWGGGGDSARRLSAYRAAVQEHGLETDPDLIAYGFHKPAGGQQAMEHILASGTLFTAVLASNDRSAIGAMQALSNAGLRVPQDIAVIGFDDRFEAAAHVPSLTTIHYPAFEEGYQGLVLLLDYIEGRVKGVRTVQVPTWLVIRESCGCLSWVPTVGTSASLMPQGAPASPTAADSRSSGPAHPEPGVGEPDEREEEIGSWIVQTMTRIMSAEMHHLSLDEIRCMCQNLVKAFLLSLEQGDGTVFHLAVQQTLQRVSLLDDDVHAWQTAVSILRDNISALLEMTPHPLARRQVEDILDQARIAISETTQRQYARQLIHQTEVAYQVSRMSAQFLAARDEADIFDALSKNLPGVGIQHAAMAFYVPEEKDPVAWSVLQTAHVADALHPAEESYRRFPTRQFPPEGLYPEDETFNLALLPLRVQEDVCGFVAFDASNLEPCAEIVRQLGAALRIVRLYREAVEGQRLAEEANRLKSRFLSMVSHELRTPLNLICGLSDMLLQESEQIGPRECKVNRRDLERIYVGVQHLDGLIRDVLDLARSDMGQLKLVCEPLDLTEVLQTVSVIGEQLARDKELAWRVEIPESLPRVWGDRTRLRQVALNLVNNAVKFTARGEIALTATAQDENIIVTVRDTGLGIPLEEHSVIFDEFRQSERTTARGYGGLGLGLAICKRLVEMHGGKISAHSSGEEGEGSTFYFTLPVMERQAALSPTEIPLAQQVLLLVKDAEGGNSLKHHLTQRGFEVAMRQVDESTDWLTWLLLAPADVVVLDLGLASKHGWEILKILKENPATRDIPVLFYQLADDKGSGSLLKMDYLTKPVGTAELAEALASQGLLDDEDGKGAEKKILVVDDEPSILEMHVRIVEAQSPEYRVLRARNGREALESIREKRPDLVLLDLMMPEMDGFQVLEAMREDEISRSIPVIVLTGQMLTEEDMARLNRGVASVLAKGLFRVEEILEHVAAALERRRRPDREAHQTVLKAMAYMHAHYAEPISRSDVAKYVSLSERHLDRCFRQEVGLTPIAYLNRYRVKQAKALLEAGDKSITEVAMEVGFSSGGYFARVFRQEVGVSPRAYLRGEED
jgi:signal transduction histidine kinase/DNA-binding LacI/PurR family transcriptional regulator/DNA-binding response OmpR family regulator